MAFNWKDYLSLAYLLKNLSKLIFHRKESICRSAVSRAYYAAFCHARNYARDKEGLKLTGKVTDHGIVKDHFRKKGQFDIASELDDLRDWRNSCDYDDVVGDLSAKLKSALKNAQEIIDKLK
jgi:uncharacterized protein (UPF0332 family)